MAMRIMITCPETEKAVFTGIATEEQAFQTSTFENNTVACPHCGGNHVWSKDDAYLEDEKKQ